MLWLVIAAGGALGALARHLTTVALHPRLPGIGIPGGIFIVNVTGCLAIGLIAGAIVSQRLIAGEHLRAFLVVGVLGGFTTFSSFGLDTFTLVRGGQPALAAANALGQMVLGLAAVWIGFVAAAWRP